MMINCKLEGVLLYDVYYSTLSKFRRARKNRTGPTSPILNDLCDFARVG